MPKRLSLSFPPPSFAYTSSLLISLTLLTIIPRIILVLRLYADHIVIVVQLSRLGAKAQIGNGGQGQGARGFEAFCPFVFGFVEEIDFQRGFLEVGETDFCRKGGSAEATGLMESVRVLWLEYGERGKGEERESGGVTEQPAISLSLPS